MSKSTGLTKTNHPYIVRSDDICSGSPVLAGTRTRVIDTVIEYTVLGRSPDEIIDAPPYLDLAKVHEALSYYYENREELDAEVPARIREAEEVRAKFQGKRLTPS